MAYGQSGRKPRRLQLSFRQPHGSGACSQHIYLGASSFTDASYIVSRKGNSSRSRTRDSGVEAGGERITARDPANAGGDCSVAGTLARNREFRRLARSEFLPQISPILWSRKKQCAVTGGCDGNCLQTLYNPELH